MIALVLGIAIGYGSAAAVIEATSIARWKEHSATLEAERDEAQAALAEEAPAPIPSPTPSRSPRPSPTPTPTPVTTFDGQPEDFAVELTVTEMQCFGSAGCNVTYRVETPTYLGLAELPTTGTIEVTYRVVGAEDTIIKSFTISGGNVSWDGEGYASTESDSAELTAEVTNVTYRDY